MNHKIIISEKHIPLILNEATYNYHKNDGTEYREHEPYVSDNKFMMVGRGTGHFGSGTYFSTYRYTDNESDKNLDDTYRSLHCPEFVQLRNGLYRVDMDLYKNLYTVQTEKEGDLLFSMCKRLNNFFNVIWNSNRYDLKEYYFRIKNNADALGLNTPNYLQLIRMAQKLSKNKEDIRSFSTVFMEYNGYNGVNISGIEKYDNTTHGSVIYNMDKVEGDIEPVKNHPTDISFQHPIKGHSMDDYLSYQNYGFEGNNEIASYTQDEYKTFENIESFPWQKQLSFIKNLIKSGIIPKPYNIKKCDERAQKFFLHYCYKLAKKGELDKNELYDFNEDIIRLIDIVQKYKMYYLVNINSSFFEDILFELTKYADKEESLSIYNMLKPYLDKPLSKEDDEYYLNNLN